MRISHAELLGNARLFQVLAPGERALLARRLEEVRLQAGETVYCYGDRDDSLYLIRSGEVALQIEDRHGQSIELGRAGAGEIFGEISLLDGGPRTESVVVTADLDVLRLERRDLDQFLRRHPAAVLELLTVTGSRLRQNAEYLRRTASRNAAEVIVQQSTFLERASDWIAEWSGSLSFLGIHLLLFALWFAVNLKWIPGPVFDPYPFPFLNLAVSVEAIFLSVFVLLSQSRQRQQDRIRAEIEYQVNVKSEAEIARLHEKIDEWNAQLLARLTALRKRVS